MDMNPHEQMRRATSEQLRAERAASHLTIDAVAAATGMNRKTVMRLESGERVLDMLQLAAFCEVYGLTLTDFMGRAQQRLDQSRGAANNNGAATGTI
jgi:transcriptional regulator with XRE-family HTH domain